MYITLHSWVMYEKINQSLKTRRSAQAIEALEPPILLAADKMGRSSGSCYKCPCMSCTCGVIGPGVKIMNISKNGRSLC